MENELLYMMGSVERWLGLKVSFETLGRPTHWHKGLFFDDELPPEVFSDVEPVFGCYSLPSESPLGAMHGTASMLNGKSPRGYTRHTWPLDLLKALCAHATGEHKIAALSEPNARVISLGSLYKVPEGHANLDPGFHVLTVRTAPELQIYLEPAMSEACWPKEPSMTDHLLLAAYRSRARQPALPASQTMPALTAGPLSPPPELQAPQGAQEAAAEPKGPSFRQKMQGLRFKKK